MKDGFTLIEMMIGMLILTVGVLGLASSTAFVTLQLEAADLRTERALARQEVMEELRSTDFGAMTTAAKGAGSTVGDYTIWWDVTTVRWALKQVDVYMEGPSYESGARQNLLTDTTTIRIARPTL